MTVTVKNKTDLVVPAVRRRAGIKNGDQVEVKVSGGMINIIPKLPSADDEFIRLSSAAPLMRVSR